MFKDKSFVVIDIETTGLNSNPDYGEVNHIIEVGAVKIEKGKITETFSSFCACPIPLPQEIEKLTGILNQDLKNAPTIKQVLCELNNFCEKSEIVGHNVSFDLGFLNYYGAQQKISFKQAYADTLTMSRLLLKNKLVNYRLATVAEYFKIKFKGHRALSDALVTAKIFLKLTYLQEKQEKKRNRLVEKYCKNCKNKCHLYENDGKWVPEITPNVYRKTCKTEKGKEDTQMRIKKITARDMFEIKNFEMEISNMDNIIFVFEPYSDNPFSYYSDFLELIDFLLFNDSYTGAKNNMHINTLAECTMEKNGVEYTIGVKGSCSETKKDGKVRMRNILDWYCVVPENELQGENGGWLGAQLSCDPQQYFYPKELKSWSRFDKNNEVNLSANLLETEEAMLNSYAKYNRRDFVNFEIENQKLIKEFREIKINKDISIGLNEEDEYVLRFYGDEVTQQEDLGLVGFCGWINNLKIFEKLWIHAGEKGKLPVFIEKERGDSLSVYKDVLIEKLRETGRQVFIVSRERDEEIEKLCDKVIIVNK